MSQLADIQDYNRKGIDVIMRTPIRYQMQTITPKKDAQLRVEYTQYELKCAK